MLFGIYAAVLLFIAFKNSDQSYYIRVSFRCDGDIFDLRRLKAKTKTLTDNIKGAQYADEIPICCNDPTALQTNLSA